MKPFSFAGSKCALVVGHPVHVLQVYGWVKEARPAIYVLTDGSGRTGISKLAEIQRAFVRVGAAKGWVFGAFTDPEIYRVLLEGKHDALTAVAGRIASDFERRGIEAVAGDAAEGYNPAHDICRAMIGAAAMITKTRTGRTVRNYDFLLAESPALGGRAHAGTLTLELDEETYREKVRLAEDLCPQFLGKDGKVFGAESREAFRVESLRPCDDRSGFDAPAELPPFYERYGEERVAAGHYARVIRYRDHLRPAAQALWDFAATGGASVENPRHQR